MTCSIELYCLIGGIITVVLLPFYKKLRNPKIYWLILFLTSIVAIFGYLSLNQPCLQMKNGDAASWLFLPFLFMILFGSLRKLFLIIFRNEPIFAIQFAKSLNQGEYRELHLGDILFTIICFLGPFLLKEIIEYYVNNHFFTLV